MHKITTFFRTLIKSLTEPTYYNHILHAKLSFSLKYFFLFYLLLATANSLVFHFTAVPRIRSSAQDLIHQLTTRYPQTLEIILDNGRATVTGVDQPFLVPFPQPFKELEQELDLHYLLALDTDSNTAADSTFITLTQSELIVRQPNNTKQSFPLEDFSEPVIIDKNAIQLFTSSAQSYIDLAINYLPWIVFLVLALFQPLGALISLSLYSIFILVSASMMKKPLPYKKSYQLGLHLFTFAETVLFLQTHLFPHLNLSIFFPLAFFGASIIVLLSLKPKA